MRLYFKRNKNGLSLIYAYNYFFRPVKIDMFQNHVHELLRDDGIELFKEYTVRILYIDSSGN